MKKTLILLLAAAFTGVTTVSAQQTGAPIEKNEYIVGGIWDNWFVSVGAGIGTNATLTNKFSRMGGLGGLNDNFSLAFDASVGKWFTPFVAGRLQYNGFEAKTQINGSQSITWNSFGLHADAMLNLTALIRGYNPEGLYDLIPFAGAGILIDGSNKEPLYVAGLLNKFRLTSCLDANVELRAGVSSTRFVPTTNNLGTFFMPLSATVGLSYNFGKNFAKGYKTTMQIYDDAKNYYEAPLRAQVEALNSKNSQLTNTTNRLSRENANLKGELSVAQAEAAKAIKEAIVYTALFNINSAKLTAKSADRLMMLAGEIKSTNSNYIIEGYADSATGTPEFNQELSLARANAIYNILVEKCGIDANRLTVVAKGGSNAYEQIKLDRNAIVIMDNK